MGVFILFSKRRTLMRGMSADRTLAERSERGESAEFITCNFSRVPSSLPSPFLYFYFSYFSVLSMIRSLLWIGPLFHLFNPRLNFSDVQILVLWENCRCLSSVSQLSNLLPCHEPSSFVEMPRIPRFTLELREVWYYVMRSHWPYGFGCYFTLKPERITVLV